MSKLKDLTGQRFGRLVVIERNFNYVKEHNIKIPRVYWKCKCDCGNIVSVSKDGLLQGKTKSCGCLNKETLSIAHKKYNEYDLTKEFGIGITSNTRKKFYFDLEDYDIIKNYCWYENQGYIRTNTYDVETKDHGVLLIHRLITGVDDSKINVDHRNHNGLDNRKRNLRITDRSHNNMNAGLSKNNKSGYTGVFYDKRLHNWWAYICLNYEMISLGRYQNKEDAIEARKKGEEKYFKDFSYPNSMNDSKEYTEELQQYEAG